MLWIETSAWQAKNILPTSRALGINRFSVRFMCMVLQAQVDTVQSQSLWPESADRPVAFAMWLHIEGWIWVPDDTYWMSDEDSYGKWSGGWTNWGDGNKYYEDKAMEDMDAGNKTAGRMVPPASKKKKQLAKDEQLLFRHVRVVKPLFRSKNRRKMYRVCLRVFKSKRR